MAVIGVFVLLGSAAPAGASTAPEQSYPIITKFGGRCLDANLDGIGTNGTRVQLWDCYGPNQLNQQWYFRQVGYYSEYQIVNRASGRCLDANAGWGGGNGTPVQLWDCYGTGQLNQIWYVYQDGDYLDYTIMSKQYGRVLDAAWEYGGLNGSYIQLWDYYGSGQLNQRWRWLCQAIPPTPCPS